MRIAFACLILSATAAVAQQNKPKALDPRIVAALHEVSATHLREMDEKLVSFGNRSTLSAATPTHAPDKGIVAAREWIRSEFERYSAACGGCLEVKTDIFTEQPSERIPTPTEIVNVYAVMRGSDPENAKRIYLVTGHYDSRNSSNENTTDPAPGANDDASGTIVSLECARVLSRHRFPASIIFLTVAGEEQGLNGSRHFAKMAKEQGWNIEAVLNNDIVGGDKSAGQDAHTVRIFSEGLPVSASDSQLKLIRATGLENDSPSRELARYIAETGDEYLHDLLHPLLIFRRDRYLRGGDHSSFNDQGFAAVRFTEFRENFDHQHQNVRTENSIEYGDLAKFVDFEYVAGVTRLNVATLASLASAPAPPAEVRLLTKQLENDSQLSWKPSPGALAASYEVLWRETSAATWQHWQNVGNATEAKIPVSKDNVIFSVRAVGKTGEKSLVAVPTPER